MDKKTRKALEGSIQKWQDIADRKIADEGSDNCPLCKVFLNSKPDEFGCTGCPVAQDTGEMVCRGTPYYAWLDHDDEIGCGGGFVHDKKGHALALAMRDYLISLRPDGKDAKETV